MIDMILNYVLLNIPEGIVVTILAFSGLKFKENRKKYLSAILSSSLLIYIVPELLGFWTYYQIALIFFLGLLFNCGYEVKRNKSFISPIIYLGITAITQIPLMFTIDKYIGIHEYMNLNIVNRFFILWQSIIAEILLAKIISKIGGINMKKGWFIGKVNDRKRGERA